MTEDFKAEATWILNLRAHALTIEGEAGMGVINFC